MFLGHPASAFASKRIAPQVSLGLLMLAPILLDVLWPVFLLLGIERVRIDPGNTAVTPLDFVHYPWSHSLLMALVWSLLLAGLYWSFRRDVRGATIVGALVASHWFLDFIAHRPDLPIYPGGPKVGLGLWHSKSGTVAVESLLLAAGVAIYVTSTRSRRRSGSVALWALVAFLALIFAANLTGPPPDDIRLIAWVGLLQLLFPLWAWWIDRNRSPAA